MTKLSWFVIILAVMQNTILSIEFHDVYECVTFLNAYFLEGGGGIFFLNTKFPPLYKCSWLGSHVLLKVLQCRHLVSISTAVLFRTSMRRRCVCTGVCVRVCESVLGMAVGGGLIIKIDAFCSEGVLSVLQNFEIYQKNGKNVINVWIWNLYICANLELGTLSGNWA